MLILNSEVVGNIRPDLEVVFQIVVLVAYLLGIVLLRPFRVMAKNVGLGLVLVTSIIASVSQILYAYNDVDTADKLSLAVVRCSYALVCCARGCLYGCCVGSGCTRCCACICGLATICSR